MAGLTTQTRARIQNESVTHIRSYYRSYYESNLVGVYSVAAKLVDSVSRYSAVFKIKGTATCTVRSICTGCFGQDYQAS